MSVSSVKAEIVFILGTVILILAQNKQWEIDGETVETVSDFIFLGSKITADDDCSHEIKRCLLLGRKAITNLCVCVCEVAQSCPTLCDPMDCSLPGSSVHGIFQAIVLKKDCHFLLQGIFLTQGSNLGLPYCRQMLYRLSHQGNLDSIVKSRDITLSTKVCLFKAMVFPVVVYGCESWTIKKAECQRIDAFELWSWRRLLRVSWTARRFN